jgi:hypothetical protein
MATVPVANGGSGRYRNLGPAPHHHHRHVGQLLARFAPENM